MRTATLALGSVLLVSALAVPLACAPERPDCYEGDFGGCTCEDGRAGYRACAADARFGACVCDGTTPGLDGSFDEAPDAEAGASAKLPFMSACTTDEECETGRCHSFTQRGSFCTKSCESVTDCPAPSTGCNRRGICKAP